MSEPFKRRPTAKQQELIGHVERGWVLVPLWGFETWTCVGADGEVEPVLVCACDPGCTKAGKHPASSWSERSGQARTPEDVIDHWPSGVNPRAGGAAVHLGASGLVCLEDDPRNGGDESLRRLLAERGPLPPTPEDRREGGGHHRYYRMPAGVELPAVVQFGPGLELLSGSHLVVVAPSKHACGASREWVRSPEDTPVADLPPDILARAQAALKARGERDGGSTAPMGRRSQASSVLDGPFAEGGRNDGLFRLGCRLRARGCDPWEIERHLQEVNGLCLPPLPEAEVRAIAKSVCRYPAGRPATAKPAKGTARPVDDANRPRCRPEEWCERPRGALMQRLADGQLSSWWTRCNRGACRGCLAFRKRLIGEDAAAAIDAAVKKAPTLYVTQATVREYEALKKAAARLGERSGRKAGGFTVWTPDGVVLVTTEAVAGSAAADAGAAKAAVTAALATAEPRGKGRPMARTWGAWRVKPQKKERQYGKLGTVCRSPRQVREVCAGLGVQCVDMKAVEGGVILRRIGLVFPPPLRERVIEAVLSVPSVGEGNITVGPDTDAAGDPLKFHLRRFDQGWEDYLDLTG